MNALISSRPAWAAAVILFAFVPRLATVWNASVTPDGATLQVGPNQTGQVASFTLTSGITSSQTYTLEWLCYDAATGCNRVGGTSVTFTYTTTINITFSTGASGSGKVILRAYGPSGNDTGYYNVSVVTYGVSVTPDGGTAAARQANTGGYSETFTIQNTGTGSNTYSFTCTGSGGVTCGTVPAPVPLGPTPAQITVSMPYSVGAANPNGSLTLTASGTSASDPGSFTVPIVAYGVSVTPDGVAAPPVPQNTQNLTAVFTVANTGSTNNTFSFTCSSSGSVSCGTVPASVPLGPWPAQATVNMPYSVGGPSMGGITLTANGTNASDPGSYTVQVMTFVPSTVSGPSFIMDSHYLLQETADSYEPNYGRITQVTDARGKVTTYQYGGNANNAFLTELKRLHDATGTVDLATDITYDTDGNVASIKDEGGTFRHFYYDGFGRLDSIRNNGSVKVKAYGYTYSATSANGWVFQPAAPNAVIDSTFLQQSPTPKSLVSAEYIDGLGRSIQTVVQDGTSYVVTATQYDLMGRTWRTWKAYTRTTAGYDASFTTNATNYYNTYHGTSTAQPYVETQYRPDALSRLSKVIPEYIGTTPTAFTLTSYGIDATPGVQQQIVEATDEAGKKKRSYTDIFGNNVKTILGYGATEVSTTTLAYNILGQRIRAADPQGLNTTYTLDTRGLLTTKTSPDAGTVSSLYDKAGNVRYTQDANQAAAGQVYFTTYNFATRPLTSGQGSATFSALDPDATSALETTSGNWLVVRAYDAKPSTAAFPWSLFSAQITPLTLANVSGRLAAVASQSSGAWQASLFSYDADGQVATRYTYTQANGGASVLTALNTTITYTRDLRGTLTQRSLTVGSSTFYHWYDYDNRGLLTKTYASTVASKPASADVTDTYLPSGQPQDYQFQGGPLVPIRYTIRGQTERIGDPTLAPCSAYPFNARYVYLPNGVVDTTEFCNASSPAAQKRYRYAFGPTAYDALNRLKSADFSGWTGTAWTTTPPAYDLVGITYDAAGNLRALQRYNDNGTLSDNLTYYYPSNSNRLSSVTDAVTGNSETWDARTGPFTYDANGNITTAPAPYSITAATYNYQNLPLSLTRSGPTTTTYRYDEAGQRISKQVGTGNTEVYLREGATTLGVFTINGSGIIASYYFNLLWADRVVGRQPITGNRDYYHFDALGSARAVVQGTTVVESHDYDPWGLEMPARGLGSGTKEAFSGKEQDGETGLDYFGARYYMPALGRWAAVDPLVDKQAPWSPYAYVLDDPTLLTDPDGRQPDRGAMAGSSWITTQQWLTNLSPADQVQAMRGELKPPNGEYEMSELNRQVVRSVGYAYANLAVSLATDYVGGIVLDELLGLADGGLVESELTVGEAQGPSTPRGSSLAAGEKVGELPKPPRGPGSAPPTTRDPKRLWTPEERAAQREAQGGKCATGCGRNVDASNSRGHHIKRHADGGRTDATNHAEVCVDCHRKLHSP